MRGRHYIRQCLLKGIPVFIISGTIRTVSVIIAGCVYHIAVDVMEAYQRLHVCQKQVIVYALGLGIDGFRRDRRFSFH